LPRALFLKMPNILWMREHIRGRNQFGLFLSD
jgi:hypothetical protein